jgi:hypothetical protein
MNEIVLTGLDGQNPLAFFAALGLLRVLDDEARRRGGPTPTLAYPELGEATPTLRTDLAADEVPLIVLQDAATQASNPVLLLAYGKSGDRLSPASAGAVRDLKPPPRVARSLLDEAATQEPRVHRLAAALFSELVTDNNGNTKPTALHFTAGQQTFLSMVSELRERIGEADVREALFGPWKNISELPSLSWDASVARNYALRASNPAKEKRGSVPAANWLGVVGLEFFPVAAERGRLSTTCVSGGWKDAVLRWPIWSGCLSAKAAASLLRFDSRRWSSGEREALGIVRVYAASILRSDQGGYGSFTPADVVLPRSAAPRT